jgi:enoyl-CoA hydratase
VIEIELNGPAKNALGTETMTVLLEKVRAAKNEPLLFTGAGDAFSAGLNLKEIASLDEAGMRRFLALLETTLCAIYQHPRPTVALINGHAIAGGCLLGLCCDWRVAVDEPKSKIGLNEVALGVLFPPRVLEIVKRRVPWRYLEEVVLGAGLVGPADALRIGLVDEVFAKGEARAAAEKRLAARVALPAEAYAATKKMLRGASEQDLVSDAEEARAIDAAVPAWISPELKKRVLAVLAR